VLDQPASSAALVQPIPVAVPSAQPKIGDQLTLVGFGRTGKDCKSDPEGKRRITLPLRERSTGNVTLRMQSVPRGLLAWLSERLRAPPG
jgi:hypothetical protein